MPEVVLYLGIFVLGAATMLMIIGLCSAAKHGDDMSEMFDKPVPQWGEKKGDENESDTDRSRNQ